MQRYYPIKIIKYKKFRTELEIQLIAQQLTGQSTGVRAQSRRPGAQAAPASGLMSTWLLDSPVSTRAEVLGEPKHTQSGKACMKSLYDSTGTPV